MNLRKQISEKRKQASQLARRAQRAQTDPRDAHECEVLANKLTDEAREHEAHLKSNLQLIEGIEKLLRYLEMSKFDSRERAISRMKLQEALMWLREECGEKTEDLKTEDRREEKN